MRKRSGGLSTVADRGRGARRHVDRRLPRLHEVDPVPAALRGQGRVQERQQPPPGFAGADRRRRGRQGPRSSARSKGDNGRARHDAHQQDKGRPLHPDAPLQDPPAHLPRGQLLRRRPARHVGQGGRRRPTFPGQPDRRPRSSSTRCSTALQSDTPRGPQDPAARVRGGPQRARARTGFNRSIKYWKPAYRDSAIVSEAMLGEHEHDLSGYIDRQGVVAGALDRNRGAAEGADHELPRDRGRVRAREREPRGAIAELPRTLRAAQPALAALNRSFPGAARLRPRPAPGRRVLRRDDRRLAAAAASSCAASSRSRSCAG